MQATTELPNLPEDWYVLHWPDDTSLIWVGSEMEQTYADLLEFHKAQNWCVNQIINDIIDDSNRTAALISKYTNIGPECFAIGNVISYKGANYYKACDKFVTDRQEGEPSFCVKRVGHPGDIHEAYDGKTRKGIRN